MGRYILRRLSVLAVAGSLLAVVLPAPAAHAALRGSPDPTWMTNGPVKDIVLGGNNAYLGGTFTEARTQRDAAGTPRARLAAFDRATGALNTAFNASVSGSVETLAISSDGSTLYLGGLFTAVNGVARQNLAAVDAATGSVRTGFRADADNTVRALAYSGGYLFAGGSFGKIGGTSRRRLAKMNGTSGILAPWTPGASEQRVNALDVSADGSRLYVGGAFAALGGVANSRRLGAVTTDTGSVITSFRPNPEWSVLDLANANGIVVAAYGSSGGGRTRAYNESNGTFRWHIQANGDCQAVEIIGSKIFIGGHFRPGHSSPSLGGRDVHSEVASANLSTGAVDFSWAPDLDRGGNTGVHALTADGVSRLHVGGDFARVNGAARSNYARFSDTA